MTRSPHLRELPVVGSPPALPLMLYDGDCGFCRFWVARWRHLTGKAVEYAPWQAAARDYPEVPESAFKRAVQLILPDGSVYEGAEAVFIALELGAGRRWPLALYRHLPGFAWLAEFLYRVVARNRGLLGRLTKWFWGRDARPPRFFAGRWLFLRMMGLIYLAAFASLAVQVRGLVGREGIVPADERLLYAADTLGGAGRAWLSMPTLVWFTTAADGALVGLCALGALAALAVILNLAPAIALAAAWLIYLSLSVACEPFLNYQWDLLLLEAGFLAIFYAPWRLAPGFGRPTWPSSLVRWLLLLLLARMMFSSGFVKLASGDTAWRTLTAMNYHYQTQPLPNWIGWWVHHEPVSLHRFETFAVFAIELVAPLFIFGPRRLRTIAFGALVLLQVCIMLTGNYAFFNLLVIALCLPLLDDVQWAQLIPKRRRRGLAESAPPQTVREPWLKPALIRLYAVAYFLGSLAMLAWTVHGDPLLPGVRRAMAAAEPFRLINGYGLFAVMTTTRPEIIIQGSDDGRQWLAYEFKYKPGDPVRRPLIVAPHQPRLDWQMWFAALDSPRDRGWMLQFVYRLLDGSPTVLGLLGHDPFDGRPPQWIRAVIYQYEFTNLEEQRATGRWWRMKPLRYYLPPTTLEDFMPSDVPRPPRGDPGEQT